MKETTGLWHPGLILVIALLKFMIRCTSLFTKKLLQLFKKVGKLKIEIADMQVQKGSTDCVVFAIAVVTSLLYGIDPFYKQDKMRNHLLCCLESGSLSVFPSQ